VEKILLFNKFFFRLSIYALVGTYSWTKLCDGAHENIMTCPIPYGGHINNNDNSNHFSHIIVDSEEEMGTEYC